MKWFRCDVCGRFISIKDIQSGKASNIMILPDSELSKEIYETLCPKHNTKNVMVKVKRNNHGSA